MNEYKIEILLLDPDERQELITTLNDLEVYEQTSFDGKRFIEVWVKPIGSTLSLMKKTLIDFASQKKISSIKVSTANGEVLIESVHPEDLEKIEKFVDNILSKIK